MAPPHATYLSSDHDRNNLIWVYLSIFSSPLTILSPKKPFIQSNKAPTHGIQETSWSTIPAKSSQYIVGSEARSPPGHPISITCDRPGPRSSTVRFRHKIANPTISDRWTWRVAARCPASAAFGRMSPMNSTCISWELCSTVVPWESSGTHETHEKKVNPAWNSPQKSGILRSDVQGCLTSQSINRGNDPNLHSDFISRQKAVQKVEPQPLQQPAAVGPAIFEITQLSHNPSFPGLLWAAKSGTFLTRLAQISTLQAAHMLARTKTLFVSCPYNSLLCLTWENELMK